MKFKKVRVGKPAPCGAKTSVTLSSVADHLFPFLLGQHLLTGRPVQEIFDKLKLPDHAEVLAALSRFGYIEGTPDTWKISRVVLTGVLQRIKPASFHPDRNALKSDIERFDSPTLLDVCRLWKKRARRQPERSNDEGKAPSLSQFRLLARKYTVKVVFDEVNRVFDTASTAPNLRMLEQALKIKTGN